MQRNTSHRGKPPQKNRFPCIVADKYPSFYLTNVNKTSEHLKRCHSPLFWCMGCLQKFNSSLSDHALSLTRADHKCTKTPTKKNQDLWDKSYVIDEESYGRLKSPGWKQTSVPHELENGGKERVSRRSWRQIRETIFPTPSTVVPVTTDELVPRAGSERPVFLGQFDRGLHVPTQQETNPTSSYFFKADLYTADLLTVDSTSRVSTIMSEGTAPQTQPSTVAFSHAGADGKENAYGFDVEETAELETSHNHFLDPLQGQLSVDSVSGAGEWGGGHCESTRWIDLYYDLINQQDSQEGP
ncbi:hypothetical protein F53441_1202 [Fusarium austroafricanum]|uniref:Uncharacterized protein n=1 Tax=Fusarium austroafricanum TaxID=2364996 RepID=A0A8H4P5D8_9HYPO|nr:hypothetical protein F53441_1202 [Fusarium austroafricanum]